MFCLFIYVNFQMNPVRACGEKPGFWHSGRRRTAPASAGAPAPCRRGRGTWPRPPEPPAGGGPSSATSPLDRVQLF